MHYYRSHEQSTGRIAPETPAKNDAFIRYKPGMGYFILFIGMLSVYFFFKVTGIMEINEVAGGAKGKTETVDYTLYLDWCKKQKGKQFPPQNPRYEIA